MTLDDGQVLEVITYLIAETLPSDGALVEALGVLLNVKMVVCWSLDEVFSISCGIKKRSTPMLAEIGGKQVAKTNLTSTAKIQKTMIGVFPATKADTRSKTDRRARWYSQWRSTQHAAALRHSSNGRLLKNTMRHDGTPKWAALAALSTDLLLVQVYCT